MKLESKALLKVVPRVLNQTQSSHYPPFYEFHKPVLHAYSFAVIENNIKSKYRKRY